MYRSDARPSTRCACRASGVSCASGWALLNGARLQPVVSEGAAGRGRRRVLGWAQGGCRVGQSICGPSFRRERPHLGLDWAAREGRDQPGNAWVGKRKWLSGGVSKVRALLDPFRTHWSTPAKALPAAGEQESTIPAKVRASRPNRLPQSIAAKAAPCRRPLKQDLLVTPPSLTPHVLAVASRAEQNC